MSEFRKFNIFRAGVHTAMNGVSANYDGAYLRAVARGYDLKKHAAPLVLGHPEDDQPALGVVLHLSTENDDTRLYAHAEVSSALGDMVRAGGYKKISSKFWPAANPKSPTPGAPYLAHVGFLGANAPAVKGLAPLAFGAPGWPAPGVDGAHYGPGEVLEFAAIEGGRLAGFSAPAGAVCDPARLAQHRRILLRQCESPGLSYVQAMRDVL
jgi:hypothetical protein